MKVSQHIITNYLISKFVVNFPPPLPQYNTWGKDKKPPCMYTTYKRAFLKMVLQAGTYSCDHYVACFVRYICNTAKSEY